MRVLIAILLLFITVTVHGQPEKNFFSGCWQMCDTEGYLELHFFDEQLYFCADYSPFGFSSIYAFTSDTIHYFLPKPGGLEKIDVPYRVISYDTVLFLKGDLNYFDSTLAVRLKPADVRPLIMSEEEIVTKAKEISKFEEDLISRSKEFVCLDPPLHYQNPNLGSQILGHWYYGNDKRYIEVLIDSSKAWFVRDLIVEEYNYQLSSRDHIVFNPFSDENSIEFRYVRLYNNNEFRARLKNGFYIKVRRLSKINEEANTINQVAKGYEQRRRKYYNGIKKR